MGGHATVVDEILESNKLNCFSQSFVNVAFRRVAKQYLMGSGLNGDGYRFHL